VDGQVLSTVDQKQYGSRERVEWMLPLRILHPLISTSITVPLCHRNALLRDSITWFMALAFQDGVVDGYKTSADLLEQDVPPHRTVFHVLWDSEKEHLPVFRRHKDSTDPMTQQGLYDLWDPWMVQSGYPKSVKVHRIRQAVANLIESKYR
jgi:hypothetical protein